MRPSDNFALEFYRRQKRLKELSAEQAKKPPKDNPIPGGPKVRVNHFSNEKEFVARIKGVGSLISYVGIPAESVEVRKREIRNRADKFTSGRKSSVKTSYRISKIARLTSLSNAYLLFLFSKGVPRLGQPPRPVLEPAIQAPWNKREIAELVAKAIEAESKGQHYKSKRFLTQAGARAAKACRDWFDDPRNNWAPNAPSTIEHKGFDYPGVDTSIMRAAITHLEKEVPSGTVAPVVITPEGIPPV